MSTRRRATLIDAWTVIGGALSDIRDIGVFLVALNILWFFSSALIITAPPATAALYAITRQFSYGKRVERFDFFRLMKRYLWTGWRWGVLNIVVMAIYGANIWFYSSLGPPLDFVGRGFWTAAFLLWLVTQMYCFPVLLEQEKPIVRIAARNAFVLVLRHPAFTAMFTLFAATLTLASIMVAYFWIFFTVSLLCYFYNRAVWYLTCLERGEEPQT